MVKVYNINMKIIVDADACPVKKEIVKIAKTHKIEVIMISDTSHVITSDYAKVVTVDKGADSVDFALINMVKAGDIVVSQDYGVAAMALAKKAKAIGNGGVIYTDFNIDALLTQRYLSKENRRKHGKFGKVKNSGGPDREKFKQSFEKLIDQQNQ